MEVTAGNGISTEGVKAQWMKGTEAATQEIALDAQGKASAELDYGDYTVNLTNVPSDGIYTPATVSGTSPSASIQIDKACTYTLTLSIPGGFEAEGITAQLYKSGRAACDPVAFEDGTASLRAKEDTYTVRLAGLPDWLEYAQEEIVAPSSPSAVISLSLKTVQYSITVNKPAEIEDELSVQFFTEDMVEADSPVQVINGTATLTLTAGNYIARLTEKPDGYMYDQVLLTPAQRTGVIELVTTGEVRYTVTVDTSHANISTLTYSDLSVQLKKAEETVGEAVQLNTAWTAEIVAMSDNYTVEIVGLPTTLVYTGASVTELDRNITISLYNKPTSGGNATYAITQTGEYLFSTSVHDITDHTYDDPSEPSPPYYQARNVSFRFAFDIPSESKMMYTFRFTSMDGFTFGFQTGTYLETDYVYGDAADLDNSDAGYFIYIFDGSEGDTERFCLCSVLFDNDQVTDGQVLYCTLEVIAEVAPAEGAHVLTAKDAIVGENTAEGMTEAYFKLPVAVSGKAYSVTFGDGLAVDYLENAKAAGSPISDGDTINASSDYVPAYLHITASDGAEISFTIVAVDKPGSSANPIVITKGEPETYQFGSSFDGLPAWFAFTPDASGDYKISVTFGFCVYDSPAESYGMATGNPIGQEFYSAGADKYTFEEGTTYYIRVSNNWNASVTVTVEDFSAVEGEKWQPSEIGEGSFTAELIGGSYYYVYTATQSGVFKFSYVFEEDEASTASCMTTFLTSDDWGNYEANILGGEYYANSASEEPGYWQSLTQDYDREDYTVNVGDKIYFYISDSNGMTSVSFKIEVTPAS